jgi:cobalamin biosynthesis protein CobT
VPLANGLKPIFDVARNRLATAKTSEDTLDIAVWVADQLKSIQQPNPNPKPQGEGKGKGEGQPTEGQPCEGQGEGSGKGEKGSTSPDQGEGEGEGASDGSDAPVGDAKNPIDNEGNLPYAREVEPTNQAPDGAGADGTYSKSSGLTDSHHRQHQSYELNADVNVSAKLRFEVRRLFDNTGTSDHQVGRKSGSVNVRTLHTIPSGNERLFKRRLDVDGIDSAVVIVLDVSGSMFNFKRKLSPIQAGLNACASLVDALNSAQVQTAVLTFGCETAVLKPFALPAKKALAVMPNVISGGGTNDFFAVRYAHEMLHATDAQRKICFVITDGRGNPSATREQVKAGESLGITTIGIGIMSDVTDIYKNSVIVRKVEDLGAIAFNKIKLVA